MYSKLNDKYILINSVNIRVRLENNEVIAVYEDEINPDYAGSWIAMKE